MVGALLSIMSSTIRPKSDNVVRRVIDEVAQAHGAKKKNIANNEFALAARVRELEAEERLTSELAYARIVLRMPLR